MSASNYLAVREDWLSLSQEEVLEPELKIVDAHHHFYDRPGWHYLQEQYIADARSGHDVRASVYMQAMTRYRLDGPDVLKPVGETAFVVESTRAMARDVPQVALGIVGHADLRVGAGVREVLDAHIDAGEGRFRGIRHLATWDADSTLVNPLSAAPRGLLLDRNYREGFAQLAPLGLSYDAWVFFPSYWSYLISLKRSRTPRLSLITAVASFVLVPIKSVVQKSSGSGLNRCASSLNCPMFSSSWADWACVLTASTLKRAMSPPGRRCLLRRGGHGSNSASKHSGRTGACSRAIFRSTRDRTRTERSGTPSSD